MCVIMSLVDNCFVVRKVIFMNTTEEKKLIISTKKYKGDTGTVTVRLPVALIESIDTIAEKTGRTRNDIVQKFLEFSLENTEIAAE